MLDTHRARATISRETTSTLCISLPGGLAPSGERPTNCAALRLSFHRLWAGLRRNRDLPRQKLRDPFAQQGPVLLIHGNVAAQVKQSLLANLVTVAPEPDQAEKYSLPSSVVLVLVRPMNMAGKDQTQTPDSLQGMGNMKYLLLHYFLSSRKHNRMKPTR